MVSIDSYDVCGISGMVSTGNERRVPRRAPCLQLPNVLCIRHSAHSYVPYVFGRGIAPTGNERYDMCFKNLFQNTLSDIYFLCVFQNDIHPVCGIAVVPLMINSTLEKKQTHVVAFDYEEEEEEEDHNGDDEYGDSSDSDDDGCDRDIDGIVVDQ